MSMKWVRSAFVRVAVAALVPLSPALISVAAAEIAVSANDNKVALVNGTVQVVRNPAPDTLTIIDLRASPPKVLAEIPVPGSVVGPPFSVALTPDERLALVTSAMKIDPGDPPSRFLTTGCPWSISRRARPA